MKSKPSRTDLLRVIARLQHLVGDAKGTAWNDRDPNRMANLDAVLTEAFDLCLEAQQFDEPVRSNSRNGWDFKDAKLPRKV